jgi:hypothetical protein
VEAESLSIGKAETEVKGVIEAGKEKLEGAKEEVKKVIGGN